MNKKAALVQHTNACIAKMNQSWGDGNKIKEGKRKPQNSTLKLSSRRKEKHGKTLVYPTLFKHKHLRFFLGSSLPPHALLSFFFLPLFCCLNCSTLAPTPLLFI